jgi:predicted anti-sigma-YlaC factor YlaD
MHRTLTTFATLVGLLGFASRAFAADDPSTLGELVTTAYSFSLSIVGLCVFVMLLYAGIRLMLGDRALATKVAQDAAVGLVLLYSAYIILNSISHQFVESTTRIP